MAKVTPKVRPTGAPRATALRVRATQVGFYDNARRRVGEVFTLSQQSEFSEKWMAPVDAETPERRVSSLDAQLAAHAAERADTAGDPTGAADPLGD